MVFVSPLFFFATAQIYEELSLFAVDSSLRKSETYQRIFFPFTSIVFVFLPLILLGTFNCFLVSAVRRSHKMRHKMTNARSTVSKSVYVWMGGWKNIILLNIMFLYQFVCDILPSSFSFHIVSYYYYYDSKENHE